MAYIKTTKSTEVPNGRYTAGGVTESTTTTVGWWERKIFSRSPLDVHFPITKRYAYRPDLVALDMYGKSSLMWVVLQYNSILDVMEDFTEGTTIILPSKSRLFSELLKK